MIAFACPSRPAGRCGFVCPVWVCLFCVCLCHRAASFNNFGKVLSCPHKRIVTIYESVHRKKHYTRGNNTIPYKLARLIMAFEKWKYSFATNCSLFMKLGSLLYVRCRHRSVKSVRALRSNRTRNFFSS